VMHDYQTTGLSLKAHPCSFFRTDLTRLGVITSREHRDEKLKQNAKVTVAGLVLMRQMPGTAKGVVFITLEDETGIANIIVWPQVLAENRRVVMTGEFLAIRGRLQRAGLVIHVIAESFIDLSVELRRLRQEGLVESGMPALIKSRDFH
jgi:error-prone DNA polymerase